jgi:hypothetical protein
MKKAIALFAIPLFFAGYAFAGTGCCSPKACKCQNKCTCEKGNCNCPNGCADGCACKK